MLPSGTRCRVPGRRSCSQRVPLASRSDLSANQAPRSMDAGSMEAGTMDAGNMDTGNMDTPGARPSSDVTRLLAAVGAGERGASDELLPVVYAEPRTLAMPPSSAWRSCANGTTDARRPPVGGRR